MTDVDEMTLPTDDKEEPEKEEREEETERGEDLGRWRKFVWTEDDIEILPPED